MAIDAKSVVFGLSVDRYAQGRTRAEAKCDEPTLQPAKTGGQG
jgi:hypothetical protein